VASALSVVNRFKKKRKKKKNNKSLWFPFYSFRNLCSPVFELRLFRPGFLVIPLKSWDKISLGSTSLSDDELELSIPSCFLGSYWYGYKLLKMSAISSFPNPSSSVLLVAECSEVSSYFFWWCHNFCTHTHS